MNFNGIEPPKAPQPQLPVDTCSYLTPNCSSDTVNPANALMYSRDKPWNIKSDNKVTINANLQKKLVKDKFKKIEPIQTADASTEMITTET